MFKGNTNYTNHSIEWVSTTTGDKDHQYNSFNLFKENITDEELITKALSYVFKFFKDYE